MSGVDQWAQLEGLLDGLDEARGEEAATTAAMSTVSGENEPISTDRASLITESVAVALAGLRVVRQTLDAGDADFDDAIKAIPVAHRLLEHAEKMDAARREGDKSGAVMHFTFDLSGAGVQMRTVEALDAPADEVPKVLDAVVSVPDRGTSSAVLTWDFEGDDEEVRNE